MFTRRFSILCAALALASVPAFANIVTYSFTASGTSIADGRDQDGTASFKIDTTAKTIAVTLTNTGLVDGISATLVGVVWSFDAGNTPGTLTLASASAAGAVDCSGGANGPCPTTALPASPYQWVVNAGSGPGGAVITSPNLFAGGGSGKPYAIVDGNTDGNSDGLSNAQHNPYLLGPVTFNLTFTGTVTSIDSAALYFGTAGEHQDGGRPVCTDCTINTTGGNVPEPTSVVLLGSILIGITGICRKKLQRNS